MTRDLINYSIGISDMEFQKLPYQFQTSVINALEWFACNQEGKTESEHNKKANPYIERANQLRKISKEFRTCV